LELSKYAGVSGEIIIEFDPGLYAIGIPNERSDVFVTANYKFTFRFGEKEFIWNECLASCVEYQRR